MRVLFRDGWVLRCLLISFQVFISRKMRGTVGSAYTMSAFFASRKLEAYEPQLFPLSHIFAALVFDEISEKEVPI